MILMSDENDIETKLNADNSEFEKQLHLQFSSTKKADVEAIISNVVMGMELDEPECNDNMLSILGDQPDFGTLLRELEDIFADIAHKRNSMCCAHITTGNYEWPEEI